MIVWGTESVEANALIHTVDRCEKGDQDSEYRALSWIGVQICETCHILNFQLILNYQTKTLQSFLNYSSFAIEYCKKNSSADQLVPHFETSVGTITTAVRISKHLQQSGAECGESRSSCASEKGAPNTRTRTGHQTRDIRYDAL